MPCNFPRLFRAENPRFLAARYFHQIISLNHPPKSSQFVANVAGIVQIRRYIIALQFHSHSFLFMAHFTTQTSFAECISSHKGYFTECISPHKPHSQNVFHHTKNIPPHKGLALSYIFNLIGGISKKRLIQGNFFAASSLEKPCWSSWRCTAPVTTVPGSILNNLPKILSPRRYAGPKSLMIHAAINQKVMTFNNQIYFLCVKSP